MSMPEGDIDVDAVERQGAQVNLYVYAEVAEVCAQGC